MTVITTSSGLIKKQVLINPPQLEYKPGHTSACCKEEVVDLRMYPGLVKRSGGGGYCCVLLCGLVLAFLVLVVGLMLYQQHPGSKSGARRYQGFCSIPMTDDDRERWQYGPCSVVGLHGALQMQNSMETKHRVLPLGWSTDADVQIISTVKEKAGEDFVNALREELDLGDMVEKISVVNNGHRVNFIHDFNDNTTGIVDDERCFIMDLEPELVLSPELFISGLEQGSQFDVSRVRSNVRAALPALQDLARAASELAARCFSRPIYRLYRDEGVVIRKRSADDPEHDYIQFSGKHVLELKIDNLPEILAYEKKVKGN